MGDVRCDRDELERPLRPARDDNADIQEVEALMGRKEKTKFRNIVRDFRRIRGYLSVYRSRDDAGATEARK